MNFFKKIISVFIIIFFTLALHAQLDFGKGIKFTKADTLRGMLTPERACYDVLNYDLDVKIDISQKFISGSNTIKFLAVADFKTLQVDLFENMKVEKIIFNNAELKYTREFNAIHVEFPDTIRRSAVQFFTVYYSGNPQIAKNPPWDGGFSWEKDKNDHPFVGVSCQGTGASLWWPCKDHQSDEPVEMMIRVTVPNGVMDVSNGRLLRTTDLQNGWTKYEWHVSYPINNYDVTVNIANYKHFSDWYYNKGYKDTLTLDYYVIPENFEKAEKQFKQVKPMMNAYYHYFGEYPFLRDGYKLVETTYLGMEHQGAIAYGNKYRNGYRGWDMSGTGYKFDYIIVHESAHEWWGNSITTNDLADMWIHEGFGTYSEALYVEYLYGHDAYLQYINSEKKGVQNDSPITGVYNVNNEGSGDMYPKGALLIHTVRSIIDNDSIFFGILKGIQREFKCQTVNSKDIEKYISQQSGIDFSEIFDRYLHYASIPKLSVGLLEQNGDLKVFYHFETGEAYGFSMPLKVTVEKDRYDFILPTGDSKSITIKNMKADDFKVASDLFYIDIDQMKLKEQDPVIEHQNSLIPFPK